MEGIDLVIPYSQGSGSGAWAVTQTLSSPAIIICLHSDEQIQQFFRISFRSHFVHLFVGSTYVPGMGLDTKNPVDIMELKPTFPQQSFAAYLHL